MSLGQAMLLRSHKATDPTQRFIWGKRSGRPSQSGNMIKRQKQRDGEDSKMGEQENERAREGCDDADL